MPWEQALRQAEASWVPLTPMSSRATNGVTLTSRPDGSLLASGPNAKLTSYVVTVDTAAKNITGLKLEALPDPALPRGGPGRDAYGHFRVTGLHVEAAPAAANGANEAQVVAIKTIKVDDSAYPFEAADLLQSDRGTASRKGGSWAINAMRDSEQRLPRQAVLAASAPFGYAGGTRITLTIDQLDGTIGQGIGRFRLAATTAADPLVGSEILRACAPR